MQNEIAAHLTSLGDSLDGIVACLDGLDAAQLNWRPVEGGSNSLCVIATHSLASAEEAVLEVLGGQPVHRVRDEEFLARGDSADPLRRRWADLRPRFSAMLETLPAAELDRERDHHRRGRISGRQALLLVTAHAATHLGEAQLTRTLLDAR